MLWLFWWLLLYPHLPVNPGGAFPKGEPFQKRRVGPAHPAGFITKKTPGREERPGLASSVPLTSIEWNHRYLRGGGGRGLIIQLERPQLQIGVVNRGMPVPQVGVLGVINGMVDGRGVGLAHADAASRRCGGPLRYEIPIEVVNSKITVTGRRRVGVIVIHAQGFYQGALG